MKSYIREVLQNRKNISKNDYDDWSKAICDKIESIEEFQEATTLFVFYPYLGEVDILPLVQTALKEGKKVYFPKVTSDTQMEFVLVLDMEQFLSGYKGIKEPIGDNIFPKEQICCDKCCMLVPGSVFDTKGNRCGYGKGYYDRYLEDFSKVTTIGVCFSMQTVEEILNVKPTDIPMDYVVNESLIIRRE